MKNRIIGVKTPNSALGKRAKSINTKTSYLVLETKRKEVVFRERAQSLFEHGKNHLILTFLWSIQQNLSHPNQIN